MLRDGDGFWRLFQRVVVRGHELGRVGGEPAVSCIHSLWGSSFRRVVVDSVGYSCLEDESRVLERRIENGAFRERRSSAFERWTRRPTKRLWKHLGYVEYHPPANRVGCRRGGLYVRREDEGDVERRNARPHANLGPVRGEMERENGRCPFLTGRYKSTGRI